MADEITSIQIAPKTRDELRTVKAQAAAAVGRPVNYDSIVLAMMECWRVGDERTRVERLSAVLGPLGAN